MNYTILIQRPAEKFIAKLPRPDKERVLRAIAKLPGEGDRKAMQGHPGLYRLRVGNYRILYTVDNGKLVVCVIGAGNRGDVYKGY